MNDIGIEIHFEPRRDQLLLSCGEEEFARLRDLIVAESGIREIIGSPAAGVGHIEIESVPAVLADRRKARRDPGGLVIGLAIACAVPVFVVGLRTILLWVLP
ncbi:hypothetical protein ACYOEI_04405 [Singulisphaera rosea]